jgi:uncharacterized membrane protein
MNLKKFIPKDIIIIALLAISLVVFRDIIFGSHSFDWLPWNIFLAFIPFAISSFLLWLDNQKKLDRAIFIIGIIFWLLFIPNTIYIVTDLIHVGVVRSVPVLYDAFVIFSSAWVGLYLGLYSIFHINQILKKRFSKNVTEILLLIMMLFISLGIYLGRFLRFNSWDVFGYPGPLFKTVFQTFFDRNNLKAELMYLVLFTIFTYLFYKAFKHTKGNNSVV